MPATRSAIGARMADPPFLDIIPIRFGVADPKAQSALPRAPSCSPLSCSTYRGADLAAHHVSDYGTDDFACDQCKKASQFWLL